VDTKFYVSAIERGAFDFVLPPFELGGLRHVVRTAGLHVRDRRRAQTQPSKVD
jgi:FixJ family two-component response regulator